MHRSPTLTLFSVLVVVAPAAAQWTNVAPGIDYRHFSLSAPDPAPNNVFVTRMDRTNPNCIIESSIAQGQLRSGRETVSGMATRYDDTINYWGESWGKRSDVVAAINGDGFSYTAPGPTSGQVISGWQAWRWPEYGLSGFTWKLDRSCFLGGYVRNGNTPGHTYQFIFFANGGNAVPTAVNKARAGGSELIVYTQQYADRTYTDNSGTEVVVEMTRPLVELPVGSPSYVEGTIRQVRQNAGSTPIPFDHVVLSGTGSYATILNSNCTVGDVIRFQFEIHDYGTDGQVPTPPSDWTKAYTSIGCFAYVLKNGIVPSADWASNTGAIIRNPRTAVAFNDNYVFFVVCDGRSASSVGMTYTELGNFCLNKLGAMWATNQDGGGSSAIWVNGQIKNVPSDGSQRAVANGLMMVVVQPKVQTSTFATAQLVTTSGSSNVRLGPGTNYGILTTVAGGTQGQIVAHALNGVQAKGYNWWRVNFGGNIGWVAESLLIGGGKAPNITMHPSPQTVAVGGTAQFSVTASGDAPLSYRWQKNAANLSNGGHYSGVATPTLTVSSADLNDVGAYRCMVTNTYGNATSDEAALTLSGQPTITQHPAPQNVCTGATAQFSVGASGSGTLGFQWQKNDSDLSDGGHYSGTNTPILLVSNADAADAGNYRCVVSNAAGSTPSNRAPLTLDAVYAIIGIGGSGGTLTGVSTDGTVVAGNNGTGGFIWSAAHGLVSLGAGTSTAGVARKNGVVVVGGKNGATPSRWDGNTAGAGTWTALPTVTGGFNPLCTSASATDVWIGGTAGSSTGSRKAARYKESSNSTSTLVLPPSGNSDAFVYGISDVGSYAGRYQFGNTSPSGSRQAMGGSTLTALSPLVGSPSTSNEGVANAISRDGTKAGGWSTSPSSSRQATVWTVANPTVPLAIPFLGSDNYAEAQALSSDGSVVCGYGRDLAVSGSQRAIIWDAGSGTRDLKSWLATERGLDMAGWVLTNVRGMSGDASVIVGDGTYNGVTQGWVALLGVPGVPPVITQPPAAHTICAGQGVTLTVAASGLGTVNYRWQKNSTDLVEGGHYSGVMTATLTISDADADDRGNYRCVASVGCSSTPSAEAALTVKAATIIDQQPSSRTTCAGRTVQFAVDATGDGMLTYAWRKDGQELADGPRVSGAATATLTITGVDADDAGGYDCVVAGGCGTATSNAAELVIAVSVAADLDGDCDVDLDDFELMRACASGAGVGHAENCEAADLDDDGDVDMDDFGAFQRCFSGAGNAPGAGCAGI